VSPAQAPRPGPATRRLRAVTYLAGTPLLLDTAGSLYAALNGAGALRAFVPGQDDVNHAALGN